MDAMDAAADVLSNAHGVYARAAASNPATATRPPAYKAVGISLAIASGVFIGTSFVLKKTGLLRANVKYNEEAGEGYGYLKNAFWWTGMTLMIIGEICNFVAYAFVDAILVTPLGALSVVITTILSAIFLKERLSFVGKTGCFVCIIGSIVIVMNAPEQSSAATIQEMKHFVIAPGFLSYAGVIIVGCIFVALWAGPRYGKRTMLVYLTICSLIGGLSVVATQGLGAAVVAQAAGTPQFNQWFLYVLLVFVVATLVTEIIYLNKALNIFNAALVTPTYYVYFTSSTIVTSAILFRGFKGSPTSIATVVMGFLQICAGVVLLQLSKSAKDVPDAAVFSGDLDQVRTVAEQEQPESEPKADAIRGTAAIIRRISVSRQKLEAEEAKRIHEERLRAQMEPIGEDEQYEWDGLRRRKTTLRSDASGSLHRRKTLHPPLGLTHFPDETDTQGRRSSVGEGTEDGSFLGSMRRRAHSIIHRKHIGSAGSDQQHPPMPGPPLADTSYKGAGSAATDEPVEMAHVYGLPPGLQPAPAPADRPDGSSWSSPAAPHGQHPPVKWADDVFGHERGKSPRSLAPEPSPHGAKRQFSFSNVFHRHNSSSNTTTNKDRDDHHPQYPSPLDGTAAATASSNHHRRPSSRLGLGSRQSSRDLAPKAKPAKNATEEERLGLVKGDSTAMLPLPDYASDDDDWHLEGRSPRGRGGGEKDIEHDARWPAYSSSDSSHASAVPRTGMSAEGHNERDWAVEERGKRDKDWEARGGGRGGRGGGGPGSGHDAGGGRGGGGGGAFI